ncbi:tetratricopeptide repeat protein [Streptomyces fradiae]|uniref:tetratricopeptide repeat protein n=1 Tax=Streptomyces fradiae TaxID=1906 RepID=UPI0033E4A865
MSADHGALAAGRDAHHNAVGDGSKVIDQSGATNPVIVEPGGTYIMHAPPLELWERETAAKEVWVPQSRAALLSPLRRTVQLMGRDEDLAQLLHWCESRDNLHPSDVRFRLITGPGGVGKSRLAEELKHALASLPAEEEAGWVSTTVFHGDDQEKHRVGKQRALYPDRPLLFVVDYAEARPGLKELLEDAYRTTGTVRVLLLARTAGRWWQELENLPGDLGYLLRAGYDEADLTDPAVTPQDLFDVALQDFATALGINPPSSDVRIEGAGTGLRALDVTARALVAVLRTDFPNTAAGDAGRMPIGDVFDELLRHEDMYWKDAARRTGIDGEMGPEPRRMTVAAAALLGTRDKTQAFDVALRVRTALTDRTERALPPDEAVARWLRVLYPPKPGEEMWAMPLQPDRLAEHLIATVLTPRNTAHGEQNQAALLEGLAASAAPHAATVLARAITDPARPDRAATVQPLLDRLLRALPDDWELMGAVHNVLPGPDPRLAESAILLTERALAHAQEHQRSSADIAAAHEAHACCCGAADRPEEAIAHHQQALELYSDLLEQGQYVYTDEHASTLNNLAVTLSDLGRHDEAMVLAQQSVELREELHERVPEDRLLPQRASAFHNLGLCLLELGRPEEALPHCQRAAELYREMYKREPGRHTSNYVRALANLGTTLSGLERFQEALDAFQQMLDLSRGLFEEDPAKHTTLHAHVLYNVGATYGELKRYEEALELMRRALELREELHGQNDPDERYLHGCAEAQYNYGLSLIMQGKRQKAFEQTQQAVQLYRRLHERDADEYADPYADALINLASCHMDLEAAEEALACYRKAVDLKQAVYERDPDHHTVPYAMFLNTLANHLAEFGHHEDALDLLQRVVKVHERGPVKDQYDYGDALTTLMFFLAMLGRREEATAVGVKLKQLVD